jgi:hypothetical protein
MHGLSYDETRPSDPGEINGADHREYGVLNRFFRRQLFPRNQPWRLQVLEKLLKR